MAITTRPVRAAAASGVVTCLVLLGPGTGALGAGARTFLPAAAGHPSVPSPGPISELFGIACTAPANCWAVGRYNKIRVDQALRWNGKRWSLVRTPRPGFASALDGVSCSASADCWAVGFYDTATTELNQILHWNGRTWSLVPAPSPTAAGGVSYLAGVRCVAPGNCWAVGAYTTGAGTPFLTLALHWNGRRWSLVATPSPGGTGTGGRSDLADVRCVMPVSCWAVGEYSTGSPGHGLNLVLHWNGRKWSQARTPTPGAGAALTGVGCASPDTCWAVGNYSTAGSPGPTLNQALHWNGRKWSPVATPDPDGTGGGAVNELTDVTCTSLASCWAVGQFGTTSDNAGVIVNQALHWNGRTWSLVPTPDPSGLANGDSNFLNGIRCASAASCWAVGYGAPAGQANRNQALHWNGTKWTAG
jgi:hypothetical protein